MALQLLSEKTERTDVASLGEGTSTRRNLILAQVATIEHVLTPLRAMRIYWRAFGWCAFMCIGAFLWGYDTRVAGGLLSVPQFRKDFGFESSSGPILPASWQSAFNTAGYIGSMFGGLWLGWISDRLGRRRAVAIACVISIVAIFIQFFTPAHGNGIFLVGKLISGVALAMFVSCTGSYCAEVSPLALRGIATGTVSLCIVLGLLVSNGVLRGTANRNDAWAYRLPFAFQWIFPVILLIGLPFAPESPWWLVRKGRYDAAEKAITHLGGPTVNAKLLRQQIQETIELEDSCTATATYIDCFRGANLKRTVVAMMVFVLQQAAGTIFVLNYSSYFFELAGFNNNDAFDLSVGVSAIGVVGNLLTFYTMNRFGRRSLFIWGMVTCTVIQFVIGLLWIGSASLGCRWAISAFTIIYNFAYQASIGPLGYVIFAEVSSAKLRSKTVGIGTWSNSLCSIVTNVAIPYLVNPNEANLGGYVGFIFGGLGFLGSIWAYFFIPETKGRTVDKLNLLYENRVPTRFFGEYKLYDGVA